MRIATLADRPNRQLTCLQQTSADQWEQGASASQTSLKSRKISLLATRSEGVRGNRSTMRT
jgi:hypothetical protein